MNVLITGGSRGIGAAAVRAFSARVERQPVRLLGKIRFDQRLLHGIILSSVRVCRLLPTYIRGKDGPMQLFYV